MTSRAVLWDFDGTLAYRTDGRWGQALLEALDASCPGHGAALDAIRARLRDGFPWHAPDVGHAHAGAEAWWAALAPLLTGACTGAGVPAADAERAVAAFRAIYLDPARWTVYPDVGEAFARLRGYRHVVVSNHVPELPALVAALGLPVDAVVTSATVGWEKPHPAVFAAGRAAAGDPAEVWMVGDNPVADVRGAEAVGIPAILVRTADAGVARAAADLVGAADLIRRAAGG